MTALDRLDAIREQAIEMTYHGGVTQEMASCAIALESALRKVLEMHAMKEGWAQCRKCDRIYPCQTVRVIEEALA